MSFKITLINIEEKMYDKSFTSFFKKKYWKIQFLSVVGSGILQSPLFIICQSN